VPWKPNTQAHSSVDGFGAGCLSRYFVVMPALLGLIHRLRRWSADLWTPYVALESSPWWPLRYACGTVGSDA
jgi:hypothetical protein